ncbi:origin recognition complex subunit 5-like [Zophobas morio]|uniref:origin recognition complex subunit 5-like n=1 Tax=Zophobas morio TaxID=2755281 RepID=UPI0030827059
MRDISSSEWIKTTNELYSKLSTTKKTDGRYYSKAIVQELCMKFENRYQLMLPYFGKVLLCASYLASHNPFKADRSIFSIFSSSRRKTHKKITSISKHSFSGPKSFSLGRMLAIFYKLSEDHVPESSLISLQIESLAKIGLLTRVSRPEVLAPIKYRCNIYEKDAMKIADSVNIKLSYYLYKYI